MQCLRLNQPHETLSSVASHVKWPYENEVGAFAVHMVLGKFVSNNELKTGSLLGSLSTKLGNDLFHLSGSQL